MPGPATHDALIPIYVPGPGAPAFAEPRFRGAGIVAQPSTDSLLDVYYQEREPAAESFSIYANRVLHAADRMTWGHGVGYPTHRRMLVPATDLQCIGRWDRDLGMIHLEDPAALAAWLDVPAVVRVELYADGHTYIERRMLAEMKGSRDPQHAATIQFLERQVAAGRAQATAYADRIAAAAGRTRTRSS